MNYELSRSVGGGGSPDVIWVTVHSVHWMNWVKPQRNPTQNSLYSGPVSKRLPPGYKSEGRKYKQLIGAWKIIVKF